MPQDNRISLASGKRQSAGRGPGDRLPQPTAPAAQTGQALLSQAVASMLERLNGRLWLRQAPRCLVEAVEGRLLLSAYSLHDIASFSGSTNTAVDPQAAVTLDSSGDLFSTASAGAGTSEWGSVFEIGQGKTSITTLAKFNDTDGADPNSVAFDSSGDLFGTTKYGGNLTVTPTESGAGTVFEIAHGSTTITALASFDGTNGLFPNDGVTLDSAGELFGTASYGGAKDDGTVFEIPHGSTSITTLASFNGTDGQQPNGVTLDSAGDLFGTTTTGGASNDGTVFELPHGSTSITTLASFNGTNGRQPMAPLVLDSAGDLLGTTSGFGSTSSGTAFEIPHGRSSITTLATFNGTDGSSPAGALALDGAGDLFGTTGQGGTSADVGTVFEIAHDSTSITTLASFNGTNGSLPNGVTLNASGDLFGISLEGGIGFGNVYELLPTTSTALSSSANPASPDQSVTFTATVTDATPTIPAGTVTFLDGTKTLGTGTLNGSGAATFTTSSLAAGAHSITADFISSNGDLVSSKSAALSETVLARSPISVTAGPAQVGEAGVAKAFTLGSFTEFGVTAPYSVIVDWGDGSANAQFNQTFAGAIAARSHVFTKAGTDTVSLTVVDAKGTAGNTATFNVTISPAAAAKLAFASVPAPIAGKAIPSIAVYVEDAYGNVITTNTSTITLSLVLRPVGATLGGTVSAKAVNGVAEFPNVVLTKAGSYVLKASDSPLTAATCSFNVVAGAATQLAFISVPASVAQATPFPAEVALEDAYGNSVTGSNGSTVAVKLKSSSILGGGALWGMWSVADVKGIANFTDLKLSGPGKATIEALDGTLTSAISPAIDVT